ncbi:hypothetical protein ACYSNU_15660 [Enterococcus sp. LJL120]
MLDIKNQVVRLKWSAIGSYGIACGKFIFALLSFSIFLGVNAFYTAAIGLGKHQGVLGMGKAADQEKIYYRRVGLLILVASAIYLIYALHLFIDQETVYYQPNVAIAIATISFTEVGVSIYGILKANRQKNLLLQAVKLLNLSSSLIGLVLTQSAILSFSSDSQHQATANAILGLIFSGVTMGIGLWMISKRTNKKSSEVEDNRLS